LSFSSFPSAGKLKVKTRARQNFGVDAFMAKVVVPYHDVDGDKEFGTSRIKRIIPGFLGVLVLLFLAYKALDVVFDRAQNDSFTDSSSRKSYGAVSATHYLATQAGIEVLKAGGNAADAIAVMQFMLAVVQPQSTGIGGGCFVLLYNRYIA
jgi:hypothetical protein